jgi:hypothetical protein
MGATIDNLTTIILQSLTKFGSLIEEQLVSQWVRLGCDGDCVFQGITHV